VNTKEWIHDPSLSPGAEGFVRLEVVKENPDMAREAVQREIDQVLSHLHRAEHIAEALGLASAIATVRKKVAAVRKKFDGRKKK